MSGQGTTNVDLTTEQKEPTRQVRRQLARIKEKAARRYGNETILKRNQKRGAY